MILVLVCSFANATELPPAGVHECFQVAVIETAVSDTVILASEAESFSHVASYVDVFDFLHSSSGLNAYHLGALSPYS